MGDPWPAIIGTLGGAVFGGGIAWLIEAGRWRRQQTVRWDDRRINLYSRVLGLTNDAVTYAHHVALASGHANPHDLDGLARMAKEVSDLHGDLFLFSKNVVVKAHNACQASLLHLIRLARDDAATKADWDAAIDECEAAREALVKAARQALGIRHP